MTTFVLVHGSWHDATAWQPTIQHLESKGHKAFAPTIAGHGKGVKKNVNHAHCTKSVVDYIVGEALSDIVLLGHSFGDTIISKVAETVPERIRRLVFLNGFVLQDGKSLNDEVPKFYVDLFDQIAQADTIKHGIELDVELRRGATEGWVAREEQGKNVFWRPAEECLGGVAE